MRFVSTHRSLLTWLYLAAIGQAWPLATAAHAQWTMRQLGDNTDDVSGVFCIYQDRLGGSRTTTPLSFPPSGPGLWDAATGTWTALSDGRNGDVRAMWGSLQGGSYQPPGGGVWASLWSGTAGSQVFLHPAGYQSSGIAGMWGDEQVGGVSNGLGVPGGGACLWHGTASSFVLLAPPNAETSTATATDGVHQYGWGTYAGARRALMWSGTPQSVQSLDPGGDVLTSEIDAATPGIEAGKVHIAGYSRAAVWHGTAASFRNIHPAGYVASEANGACETGVAGDVLLGGTAWHPAVWLGPELAFQELPLPAGYGVGFANCISFYNGQYYVGGYVAQDLGFSGVAYVWVGVPAPASALPLAGLLVAAVRRRRGATRS